MTGMNVQQTSAAGAVADEAVAPQATKARKRYGRWMLVAEIVLVIAILGMLVLTWLPAIVGPHPGSGVR